MSYESQDLNMSIDADCFSSGTDEPLNLKDQLTKFKEENEKLKAQDDAHIIQIKNLKLQLKIARKEIAKLEAEKDDASDSDNLSDTSVILENFRRQKDNRLSDHVILNSLKMNIYFNFNEFQNRLF